jgi:hypothetical protein
VGCGVVPQRDLTSTLIRFDSGVVQSNEKRPPARTGASVSERPDSGSLSLNSAHGKPASLHNGVNDAKTEAKRETESCP